ncbi:MAG: glycosyltransferase family 39 protein [Variovorax sp.]|nr:glycosyltransferase family 39 protein [Variovorax sp.]
MTLPYALRCLRIIAPKLVMLTAAIVALRFAMLGSYPLSDNTESRYAEIARHMVASANWVTLMLPGDVVFWGKPPLSSWASAAGLQILGINEWGARLPVAMMGLGVTALTWGWAKVHDLRVGLLALSLLWGSVVFFASAGAVMTDMALMLSVTLGLSGFRSALAGADTRSRRLGAICLAAGLAAGLLAKGPVAIILILGPIVIYAATSRQALHSTWAVPWFKVLLASMVIAFPWYALAEMRTPGFLEYFIVGEHWKRFTQPGWTGDLYGTAHEQPRGLIWLFLACGLMPWTLLVPFLLIGRRQALRSTNPRPPRLRLPIDDAPLLIAWLLVPVLFFTLSRNILWTYILPVVPAAAILCARWLARDPRQRRVHATVCAGLIVVMAVASSLLLWQADSGGVRSAKGILAAAKAQGHAIREVVFLGPVPSSASFYSRGNLTGGVTIEQLMAGLDVPSGLNAEHAHQLIAASSRDWDALPDAFRRGYPILAHVGGYVLLESPRGATPTGRQRGVSAGTTSGEARKPLDGRDVCVDSCHRPDEPAV